MELDSFHDFLPTMADKLGEEGLMEELAKGFDLLADPSTGTITFASLKRNARYLGLEVMTNSELREMIMMGDTDGNGALNLREFCIVMISLSPSLMEQAQELLEDALTEELEDSMEFWV